jgi:hypothetical protein
MIWSLTAPRLHLTFAHVQASHRAL